MRVYNFSAGPACMPLEVLERAAKEMPEHNGHGMSVMEMSHRSKMYEEIIQGTEASLRRLMGIPANYKVLFLQGGASMQFAMVPLNLFSKSMRADFVNTGNWSKRAISEAKRYGKVNIVASSEDRNFCCIPDIDPSKFDPDADFFHITSNNTLFGTRYRKFPDTANVPLVADMSSNILSEPVDVSRFGLIYAGAQKNIGPSGLCIVIIREDLIGRALPVTPTMLNYKTHADENSLYNTPPTYSIYIAGLMLEWLEKKGGIPAIHEINEKKAALLYDFLDNSKLFRPTVTGPDRSIMNIPFVLPTEELNAKFIKEAEAAGLVNLKGHRLVGGMRASIYNYMPIEGVRALVEFMKKFELDNK